jgi:hypothetical protein
MVNMNLLTNLFGDDLEILSINKRSLLMIIVAIIIIISVLLIKKDNYYQNVFDTFDNGIAILVEKDYINEVKNSKIIIINDLKYDYDIVNIEPIDDSFIVKINMDLKYINSNQGSYKIHIGKERLFDYIIKKIR